LDFTKTVKQAGDSVFHVYLYAKNHHSMGSFLSYCTSKKGAIFMPHSVYVNLFTKLITCNQMHDT